MTTTFSAATAGTPSCPSPIATALADIRERIATATHRAHRAPDTVTLVAVSKFHPQSSVVEALQAGQAVFGENRVQEAAEKFPPLRDAWPALRLHIIGGLQTNKVLEAVRIADMIESLDRPSLADALARAADRAGRLPDLLVQVNTGDESQKSGIPRAQADSFITSCRQRFGDAVRGLMCIPPADADPVPHFRYLADLARAHDLKLLSMGMSADFEAAITAGATHVRVGSAIFGHRPASPPNSAIPPARLAASES
ncbi:YggS family pyridoxal phosphate-dependent enzyme [Gluconacetobacter aggeris]|uniref:Pyridoxal phosphate homeostasis protein n=1 Tax=Gluconacetobacter aggeris TaxID=1286186 RepID=A0A7W4NWE7_9PROT|nr:YggS family pyridoxal phosphate-dependent enzyme [Gluconacetobacter aggeris]MBB2168509.1 YggS family pyridoxal phosphate-dependent enzyme [Gluconacetobacter aggeris]